MNGTELIKSLSEARERRIRDRQCRRAARARVKMSAQMKHSFAMALLPLVVAAVAFSTQTYAFFTSNAESRGGVIKAGTVNISLLETMIPAGGGAAVPFTAPLRIMPATTASKIVSVRNNGTLSVYVRLEVNREILLSAANLGETTDPTLVGFTPNTAYWTEQDGFYYYNYPLEPGQETQPLFTEVQFDPAMGNLYKDSQVVFRIDADAIQADYTGASPLTAVGWPERMSE